MLLNTFSLSSAMAETILSLIDKQAEDICVQGYIEIIFI